MKEFLVKKLVGTYKNAKEYLDEAMHATEIEIKKMLKDLTAGEIAEFEKVKMLYHHDQEKHYHDDHGDHRHDLAHDYWLDFFTNEIADIRKKLTELNT